MVPVRVNVGKNLSMVHVRINVGKNLSMVPVRINVGERSTNYLFVTFFCAY